MKERPMRRILALTAVLFAAPLSADAQQDPEPEIIVPRRTMLEFSELTVTGETQRPRDVYILSRRGARFRVLIQIRADFRPELLRSVEAL
jgi:hypothetical protein